MLTHKDRFFVNTNANPIDVNHQCSATRDTWLTWFMVDRSFHTSVNHRSYAQVLQSGCKNASVHISHQLHKRKITTSNSPFASNVSHEVANCVPTKCVPLERNMKCTSSRSSLDLKRNQVVRGKPYMQESPLQLRNRYEILQSVTDTDQHGHHLNSQLEGNKTKTGNKLGQKRFYIAAPVVTNSIALKGNKNKTGNKLGKGTQEAVHNGTVGQTMHHTINFRGNKNETESKSGQVLYLSAHSNQSDTGIQQQQAVPYTMPCLADVHANQEMSTCHDLAFVEEEHNDNYVKLYDVANFSAKCKRNIPDYVYHCKFQSQDYMHCVQQNGKDIGFLPLNDLMVYTGEHITWTKVPSVIEAHKIIKQSAVPNFMGARIPVASQLNINTWKSYLTGYWDNQIVDLLQYGFPLDFDRSPLLQGTYVNLSSALTMCRNTLKLRSNMELL